MEPFGADKDVQVGSMLFTLVDPTQGNEVAYNRWYERDHFYSGCMIGPWLFAGRRWVSTRPLKDLRFPADTPSEFAVAEPVDAGSFLATYFIHKGHEAEHFAWANKQVFELYANDRGFEINDTRDAEKAEIIAELKSSGAEILVKVGWTASGGQYLSVRDNGTGIPEDEIETVLATFGRGSQAIKNADQGSGLGLPIVKSLVELHGGVGEFLGCRQWSFLVLNRLEVSPLIDQQHGSECPEGEPEEGAGEGEDLSWSSQQRFRVGFLTDNQDGPDGVGKDVEERCDCDDAGRQLEPCAFFSEQLAGAPS